MPGKNSPHPHRPDNISRANKSVFNLETVFLTIGDQLDGLIANTRIEDLDPGGVQPASRMVTLVLVTLFQYAVGLPDRLAAAATRTRIDWKYALHLPRDYPGLNPMELCRFRQALSANPRGLAVFEQITTQVTAMGLLSRSEKTAPDAQHILLAVCNISRLDRLYQAITAAIEAFATEQPEWLRIIALPHWYERYSDMDRDELLPQAESALAALALELGADAHYLLEAIHSLGFQSQLPIQEVQQLKLEFEQQFRFKTQPNGCKGELHWRADECTGCDPSGSSPT